MSTINATLEIGHSNLEVEIEYNATKGCRPSWEDPGWPPEAELVSVYVTEWNDRSRSSSWLWEAFERIAFNEVQKKWKHFEALCLDAETELRYERQCDE